MSIEASRVDNLDDEVLLASRDVGRGLHQTDIAVPGIHCGGCVQKIERALSALPGVNSSRVNLSTKRASVRWSGDLPPPLLQTLSQLGFEAYLGDFPIDEKDPVLSELIRALAVAGFAASNIMLLSVSVWSGAEPETRNLFHGISALIAIPAIVYSGRIFFRSAWNSLRHGRTNMDVPISIGVVLACALSVYETFHHGAHAYFDAAITLVFFLLIGRTLDHVMRERARTAVKGLARLGARGATVINSDGTRTYLPVNDIAWGMTILLPAGERVPVDARVLSGKSEIDCALVSGESLPQPATIGSLLQAGTLNLSGPLTIVATAPAKDSFFAEMVRMMEAAESGRTGYRRIADRAAQLYAPIVHLTAFLTFLGWMAWDGNIHHALTTAIAVLIITCPCALGLAVPIVQVAAARRLFEQGIMVKDGGALERLAEVDTVIFDKTGTLTCGEPQLAGNRIASGPLAIGAAIAAHSRHPYSRALAALDIGAAAKVKFDVVTEEPGHGLEAHTGSTVYRLGRPDWALQNGGPAMLKTQTDASVLLSKNSEALAAFEFEDRLRRDASEAVAELVGEGLLVEVLSGDRKAPVQSLADMLGVQHQASVSPADKADYIAAMMTSGRKVLMVGDGLNDAPALMAAHASIAPASAVDVGRNAADLVFLRESLFAVPEAIAVACSAARLVRENLSIAVLYNIVAVPVAILGYVTPLIAALAMSGSSLIVVANALRLQGGRDSESKIEAARQRTKDLRAAPAGSSS